MVEGELKEQLLVLIDKIVAEQSGSWKPDDLNKILEATIKEFPAPTMLTVYRNKKLGCYNEKNYDYEKIQTWFEKWFGEQK